MLTLAQLAEYINGVWHGNANHAIFNLSSLSRATSNDVAYFDNLLLQESLESTLAGAVVLKPEHASMCPVNCIVVSNPLTAIDKAAKLLLPEKKSITGIHVTAQIHPAAQIGQGVSIGANSIIGDMVMLADGVCIGANTVIESQTQIGCDSHIASGVIIHSGSRLGQNIVINHGVIIGSSPFNYLKQHGVWQQGLAVGGVIIADGVHIGANTVIDRGTLSDTFIGRGVCVDNLVQIAHDVIIGSNTAIAGCAAIGSYAQIGSDCIIGGASCIAANVHLTDDVVITGMSTVSKSISKPGIYSSGTLVHEHQRWRRNVARFRRLDDYMVKLGELEKKLASDSES